LCERCFSSSHLVEEQIAVVAQQVAVRHAAVGHRPHHRAPVGALEIRLDRFVVFAVTAQHKTKPGQPVSVQ